MVPAVVTRDALVVCIGNEARGDDGAGAEVARLLDGRLPAGARLLAVHQLDVALAADVAAASLVVFVDAERRGGAVEVRDLAPGGAATTHSISPGALLALAEALYGASPAARLVSVPASDLGHGTRLSARTLAACEDAAAAVAAVLASR